MKETHSAVVTWEGGATLELALLTPLEVRLWPARSGRSLRPAVHLLVWAQGLPAPYASRMPSPSFTFVCRPPPPPHPGICQEWPKVVHPTPLGKIQCAILARN